ncbi:unnamed protein product [Ambrosiozyma monospora]|uniref:Unnamed protein product n=1 Tax=Ambrosiozyma monospora TaxID=43982 RepID=A0ACB5T7H4_AMBMO|nr:unnamed protein product [Ambrosiozyma monospora]
MKNTQPRKVPNKKHDKKSRKTIEDLFVQGTNDNSIVSKRSVERLYTKVSALEQQSKEYFKYFVRKTPRRSPAINRGYWLRMHTIRDTIEKIIQTTISELNSNSTHTISIVNLGCGFDPLPFQLIEELKLPIGVKLFCVDIDYPHLIHNKVEIIKLTPDLLNIIVPNNQPVTSMSNGIELRTNNYAAVGCDLNDTATFRTQMTQLGLRNTNTTNIFISEVALAYMSPQFSNSLIQQCTIFSQSHFILLEQILPSGSLHPFGRQMLKHFQKMEAPLKCVEHYPLMSDQMKRFEALGWREVEAKDLLNCWDDLDTSLRAKVQNVEAFDEWEEFILFGQHYMCLHASNLQSSSSSSHIYSSANTKIKSLSHNISPITFEFKNFDSEDGQYEPLSRKFASGSKIHDMNDSRFLITCGSAQSRLNSTVALSRKLFELKINQNETSPVSRQCHSCCSISSSLFLFGGRTSPGRALADAWKLTMNTDNSFDWIQLEDMPVARSKHSSVAISDTEILVVGGLSTNDTANLFSTYSTIANTWTPLHINLIKNRGINRDH